MCCYVLRMCCQHVKTYVLRVLHTRRVAAHRAAHREQDHLSLCAVILKGDLVRAPTEFVVQIIVRDNPEAPGGKAAFPIYRGSKSKGTREFTGRVAVADRNALTPLWRRSVVKAARPNGRALVRPVLTEPLIVRLLFALPRPVSVRHTVRPYPIVRPDVDNLVKPTHDALTDSGIWKDDALVISLMTSKAYVNGFHADGTSALDVPGCVIEIYKIIS